jgi:hypothetical protein
MYFCDAGTDYINIIKMDFRLKVSAPGNVYVTIQTVKCLVPVCQEVNIYMLLLGRQVSVWGCPIRNTILLENFAPTNYECNLISYVIPE